MLGELNDAVLTHFQSIIADMGLTVPLIFLCPVDDEETHFAMAEELLSEMDTQLKYPFAVVARGQTPELTTGSIMRVKATTAHNVVVTPAETGDNDIVKAAPIRIMYTFVIYTDDLDFIDSFIEQYILSSDKAYEHFSYTPTELNGEEMDGTIVFDELQTEASSLGDTRESGLVFTLTLPFEMNSVLTTPVVQAPVIEEVQLDIEANSDISQ